MFTPGSCLFISNISDLLIFVLFILYLIYACYYLLFVTLSGTLDLQIKILLVAKLELVLVNSYTEVSN